MEKNVTLTEEQIDWIIAEIRSYKKHVLHQCSGPRYSWENCYWGRRVTSSQEAIDNLDPGDSEIDSEELELLESLVDALQ